jgi:hypothetical protein
VRTLSALAIVAVAACTQQSSPPPTASVTITAVACRLPVWWYTGQMNVAFVTVPSGIRSGAGSFRDRQPGLAPGASYTSQGWLPVPRKDLSPDGSRYVFWEGTAADEVISVATVGTGSISIAFHGPGLYIPIAFASDGIYLVKWADTFGRSPDDQFQNLYRLDPAGPAPQLVRGSNRQVAWSLIADGAAWGVNDALDASGGYIRSILRLDLLTSEVTTWLKQANKDPWPLGVDARHRLFVRSASRLWRVDAAGSAVDLPWEPIVEAFGPTGFDTGFVSGPEGVWLPGRGGIWLYGGAQQRRYFIAGAPDLTTYPAGSCLS